MDWSIHNHKHISDLEVQSSPSTAVITPEPTNLTALQSPEIQSDPQLVACGRPSGAAHPPQADMRLGAGTTRSNSSPEQTNAQAQTMTGNSSGRSLDMNRTIPETPTLIFGSQAPLQRRPTIPSRSQILTRATQSSRTHISTPSGAHVPKHLHGEFLDWLERREVNLQSPNAESPTTQSSRHRLTEYQVQRRQVMHESVRRQRASILLNRRSNSLGTPSSSRTESDLAIAPRDCMLHQDQPHDIATSPHIV